ncbi:hypothetical protein AMECASPLE_026528 [Ameca splendens]|uniref:Uncharacterized protein n=1 Tax=Ameca splendens TaxID=208324 RepID=A0ABV0YRX4_9TELE
MQSNNMHLLYGSSAVNESVFTLTNIQVIGSEPISSIRQNQQFLFRIHVLLLQLLSELLFWFLICQQLIGSESPATRLRNNSTRLTTFKHKSKLLQTLHSFS